MPSPRSCTTPPPPLRTRRLADVATVNPVADREQLLTLTRAMLEHAAAGQWEALMEIELERQKLLGSGTAGAAPAPFLQELLELNERLVVAVTSARDTAAEASQSLQAGMRAVSAYGANR